MREQSASSFLRLVPDDLLDAFGGRPVDGVVPAVPRQLLS
jgi:hypothetical protein